MRLGESAGALVRVQFGIRNVWAVSLLDVRRCDRILYEIGSGPGIAKQEISRVPPRGACLWARSLGADAAQSCAAQCDGDPGGSGRSKVRRGREGPAMNRSRRVLPAMIAILTIITMIVLNVAAPLAIVVQAPFSYAGALLLATGTTMVVWSRRAFKAAGTPIKPFIESTALIRHGLYRWSRNPMYLGGIVLVAGVAILLGS